MLLEDAGAALTGVMGRERCWMKILHWGTAEQHPAPCGLLQNEGANFRIKTNRGKHGVDKDTSDQLRIKEFPRQRWTEQINQPRQGDLFFTTAEQEVCEISLFQHSLSVQLVSIRQAFSWAAAPSTIRSLQNPQVKRTTLSAVTCLLRQPTQRLNTIDTNGLVSQAWSPLVLTPSQLSWTPLASGTWQL